MAREEHPNEKQNPFSAAGTVFTGNVESAKRLGEFQTELAAKFQDISRHWIERVQSDAKLTMEFASQIASARELPDAMNLYQRWAALRVKAAGEDADYALSAGRELMETASRVFKNGATSST